MSLATIVINRCWASIDYLFVFVRLTAVDQTILLRDQPTNGFIFGQCGAWVDHEDQLLNGQWVPLGVFVRQGECRR